MRFEFTSIAVALKSSLKCDGNRPRALSSSTSSLLLTCSSLDRSLTLPGVGVAAWPIRYIVGYYILLYVPHPYVSFVSLPVFSPSASPRLILTLSLSLCRFPVSHTAPRSNREPSCRTDYRTSEDPRTALSSRARCLRGVRETRITIQQRWKSFFVVRTRCCAVVFDPLLHLAIARSSEEISTHVSKILQ